MKLKDIVNARDGLQRLVVQEMPLPTAYAVLKLTDRCNLHLSFYGNERAKLGADPDPERLSELENMPVEDFNDFEPIPIPITERIKLSPTAMKALEPFVMFFEDE